ncbi:MAG: 2OG-Fe(II) oxygenase [Vicinamibacterales bacterium]
MLAVTRGSLVVRAEPEVLAGWKETFRQHHALVWPGFLGADLGALVRRRLAAAPFTTRHDGTREIEQQLDDPVLHGTLQAVLNDPALWRLVQDVTGCAALGGFSGRIYRREARGDGAHYFPWHSDTTDGRVVGFSLNLGEAGYDGGRLQIREADTGHVLSDLAITGPGDAMIFRIAPGFEHQVTPVTGPVPRTVLAGWFRTGFDYWSAVAGPDTRS